MSRAFLTSYHNYSLPYKSTYHHVFYDYFVENFPKWCDLVDTVYIIDSWWDFSEEDKKRLWDIKKEVVFWKNDIHGHVNKQYEKYFPQIKEDEILYMDNDCFIYDRKGIQCWFDALGDYDLVIPKSNVGVPEGIKNAIWKKYPYMKELNACSFYQNTFLVTKHFFEEMGPIDWNEYNPFPEGTYIPELEYTTGKGEYGEFACDFIYKIIKQANWKEMPYIPNQGFHHLHSVSWAYLLLNHKKFNHPDYQNFIKIQPLDKFLKILSWYSVIDTKNKYDTEVKSIMTDFLRANV